MTTYLAGHLGSRVSALVDGQMSREEADRAWSHVYSCPQCHERVAHEGWIKSRLAGLAETGPGAGAPASLKGALVGLTPAVTGPVPPMPAPHHAGALRPAGLTMLGGGALGAAMLGVLALGAAPTADPLLAHQDTTPTRTSTVGATVGSTVGVAPTGPIEPVALERPRAVGVLAYVHH